MISKFNDNEYRFSYLSVGLKVEGKKVLVVGGGNVALHKIRVLVHHKVFIRVVTLSAKEEVKKMVKDIQYKFYEKKDLDGFSLVYACTDDATVNKRIYQDCQALGILVNVPDNPALCDFISPAIWHYGDMQVAVHSDARNVRKSVALRDKIKQMIHKNGLS